MYVLITVIVDESADELFSLQHREQLERLRLGQHVTGLEQLTTRDKVVRFDAGEVVR